MKLKLTVEGLAVGFGITATQFPGGELLNDTSPAATVTLCVFPVPVNPVPLTYENSLRVYVEPDIPQSLEVAPI